MGYLYMLVAAVLWGLLGPVARVAFQAGVSPLEVAFWRASLGGLLFAGHAVLRRDLTIARRDVPAVAGFGVVGVSFFYLAYQLAIETGGAALASVLLYTAPAWVALIGVLLLNERMTVVKLAAVALTLLGIVGVALGGGRAFHFSGVAILWGLLSGVSYAVYYPFGKYYFDRYAPTTVFAFALPIGAICLFPFTSFASKPIPAWGALLWISVASTYCAYIAYGAGLRRLEATHASIIATLEPVVATAAAYLWWSERFGPWGYAGSMTILAAVLLTTFEPDRKQPSA